MNAAERILLSLDAHECWAVRPRAPSWAKGVGPPGVYAAPPLEAIVIGGDGPQDSFAGLSAADLKALIANKDVEMNAMALQVVSASPDIKTDFAALQKKYQAARDGAQSATGVIGSLLPDFMNSGIDVAYNNIITALQPVPNTVTKGDKQDIANRLIAAGWKPAYKLPQPLQQDAGSAFLQKTDPKNIGDELKKIPDVLPQPWKWIVEHPNEIIIGAVAVVGGVLLISILPALTLPSKLAATVAKGAAAL